MISGSQNVETFISFNNFNTFADMTLISVSLMEGIFEEILDYIVPCKGGLKKIS